VSENEKLKDSMRLPPMGYLACSVVMTCMSQPVRMPMQRVG
jgi:hypothetical protein